jgi:hypothetical protein
MEVIKLNKPILESVRRCSSYKLLKIFRYRHVIPTGFLIAEFERNYF